MSFMKPMAPGMNDPNCFNVVTSSGSNFMVNNPSFDPHPHIQVTTADTSRLSMPLYTGYCAPPPQFLPHHTPAMQTGCAAYLHTQRKVLCLIRIGWQARMGMDATEELHTPQKTCSHTPTKTDRSVKAFSENHIQNIFKMGRTVRMPKLHWDDPTELFEE